jgi:hypothetical protein
LEEDSFFLLCVFSGKDMARRTPLEDYAISRKIVKLMREGYPQDQAAAIAFRMWRDGELNLPKTPDQIRKERDKRRRDYFKKLRLKER